MKFCNYIALFMTLNGLNGLARAEFKIVDPFPENIYPLEFSSAEVTCVAFDSEDPTVMPAEITFVRRNMFGEVTDIKPDENIHFTSKTEENGRKLFVTMHIRNVTEEFDSLDARYECHARKVDGINRIRHGFSVNVIRLSEIPEVFVSPKYDSQILQRGSHVTLTCNVTQYGYGTSLKRISWLKDGKKVKNTCSVRFPDPASPEDMLDPLVLDNISFRDEGTYTCLLEVLLRRFKPLDVSDGTKITVGWKPEGCYKEHKLPNKRALQEKYYTVNKVNKNAPDRIEQIFMKCKEQAEKNGYEIFGIRRNNVCVTSTNGQLNYQKYGMSSDCVTNQQGHGIGKKDVSNFVYTR